MKFRVKIIIEKYKLIKCNIFPKIMIIEIHTAMKLSILFLAEYGQLSCPISK